MSYQNAHLANHLNELVATLLSINAWYNRDCGTITMASEDTENQIEAILDQIDSAREVLGALSDDEIAEFADVETYRSFLEKLDNSVKVNRESVAKAREFLDRYKA